MSYAGIILALISFVNNLFTFFKEKQWIAEGEARQIAKTTAEIIRKTAYAKATADEITDLSDSQLDDLLQWLESGQPGDNRR